MGQTFMPDVLAGQVALVTGGTTGIGRAIATSLATCGSDVVITSRIAERAGEAASELSAMTGRTVLGAECDVRNDASVIALRASVLDEFGTLTILVNNAAANFEMQALRMNRRAFATVIDVDLIGTFNVTAAFINEMVGDGGGAIVNIVVPYPEHGFPGFAHAGAAKAGIVSLTRTWAREWGPYGVRVNAVGPGPIATDGAVENMLGLSGKQRSGAFGDRTGRIPLGRLGNVQDVASACTFLCTPAASWISGIVLDVDGGLNVA